MQSALRKISPSSIIADFACGVGDLLVACSAHLPVRRSLTKTIAEWSTRLIGRDLQPEFVRAAKARLVLAAVQRGLLPKENERLQLEETFLDIRTGCGHADASNLRTCSHIVINPPFTLVAAPSDCEWAGGSVNAAALFVDTCLRNAKPGASLVAILPEVLRCGTRYQRWRELIERLTSIKRIESIGQFDRWTDVDVFVLEAEVRTEGRTVKGKKWNKPSPRSGTCRVGDYFEVSVGPVVPFRVENRGPWVPYFHARASRPGRSLTEHQKSCA